MRDETRCTLARGLLVGVACLSAAAVARAAPFAVGDIFVGGSSNGVVDQYRDGARIDGLVTGTGTGSTAVGLCTSPGQEYLFAALDRGSSGNLYRFDAQGRVQGTPLPTGSWAALTTAARACAVDRGGNVYVAVKAGAGFSAGRLIKYAPDATSVATFQPQGIGETTSMDLRSDQCTLVYAAEGRLRRFDACAGQQLPDLDQSGLGASCRALRLRRNGEAMVVCGNRAYRMGAGWQVLQTYEAALCRADQPDQSPYATFLAVNWAPDGFDMWLSLPNSGIRAARLCRLNVESGHFSTFFDDGGAMLAVAVQGEPLAAARRCRALFGGLVICLERAFPYLRFAREG